MVGNTPNFSGIEILKCFLRLHKKVSRQELSKKLLLGEGTVRTILEILKSNGLLESDRKGHHLSAKGIRALDDILKQVSIPKVVKMENLYEGIKKVGLVVKNNSKFKSVYKLRDIAVKNGAEGALILVKEKGKLAAPQSDYEMGYASLEDQFEVKNGDMIIISFACNMNEAENGALGIAMELDASLKKFIKKL